MMKITLVLLAFCLLTGVVRAQSTDKSYYAPYNFPQKYESDKLNKNFSLMAILPAGSKYYGLSIYLDVARIRVTEFMNINFGWGLAGGISSEKNNSYSIAGQQAYTKQVNQFGRLAIGGGLTFRLLNPFNFSIRSGITGGYEHYKTSQVHPLRVGTKWEEVKYIKSSEYIRPGFFYSSTLFYKKRKSAIGLSYGVYYMASGPETMVSLGYVFPVGN